MYELLTSPDQITTGSDVLRESTIDREHLRFQDGLAPVGRDLCADRGREDSDTGRVWALLHAAQHRVSCRRFGPDVPPLTRDFQMFEVGPWSEVDTNGDGVVDTLETRDAARKVAGLTPISEESRIIDNSWTLNVAHGVKDQHADEFTLNFEREVARNLSVGATYIYKHTTDMLANIPINRETGQQWEYERKPFTTSAGQEVRLYSIVQKDYDQNGVIDGDDIAWIGDNGTSCRSEHAGVRRHQAQARLPGAPVRHATRGTRTSGRRWRRSCTRTPPGSAAARCARTSTSRVRCSGTTTG